MRCSWKHIGFSIGIILLLILACALPPVLKYSDGLEATNIKRNNLLVATLIPLVTTIVGFHLVICISKTCLHSKWKTCNRYWWGTIFVVFTIGLCIPIPVGVVFGKQFAAIPVSCASMDECASHCSDRNGHLQPNLTDIREVKLPKLGQIRKSDYMCGRCSCVCPEYLNQEECKPVHHSHFGFSTSTKIAIGVSTSLAVMFMSIAVAMCCFDSACCAIAGFLIGIPTILLLICTMPILVVYSNNFEATTFKRNNLLIATLVPLTLAIIGFIVTYLLCFGTDTERRGNKCQLFTLALWLTVLAISIPVGLEYGLRFSNVPPSCHSSTDEYCSPYTGLHTPTKIALGIFGLAVILIIGVIIWSSRGSFNRHSSEGASNEQWHTSDIFYTEQSANINNTRRDLTDDSDDYSDGSFDWPPTDYPNPVHSHGNVHGYPGEIIITRYDEAYPSEHSYQTISDGNITESTTDYLEPINEQTHNMEQRNETGQRGTCAICMEQQASMLMRPCKHVCLCPECWNQYKSDNDSCPICRRRLDMGRVERIYLS